MNEKEIKDKEELSQFLKIIETERCIWRGIARRRLFIVDRVKDKSRGKTISLKNIAESIDVRVLVESPKKAKILNDSFQTDVFIGQSPELGLLGHIEVLLDDNLDYVELSKLDNLDILGGVYSVDTVRYISFKEIVSLEKIE